MPDNHTASTRLRKDLFDAAAPFAEETWTRSWWHVGSTLVVLVAVLFGAAMAPWWPLRLAASIVGGLVLVRAFILYHDFMHGAQRCPKVSLPGGPAASGGDLRSA